MPKLPWAEMIGLYPGGHLVVGYLPMASIAAARPMDGEMDERTRHPGRPSGR